MQSDAESQDQMSFSNDPVEPTPGPDLKDEDMYGQFRLSRFSYPRATWWVMVLIAVIFLAFGLFAEAWLPQAGTGLAEEFSNAHAPNWIGQIFDRFVGH